MAVESSQELGYITLTAPNVEEALKHPSPRTGVKTPLLDMIKPGGINGVPLSVNGETGHRYADIVRRACARILGE